MDTLAAMRGFVEIVDRGSLTKAAESLGKSLPTMVRTLANLEEHLGVQILARTTRRMSLTPEGRDYLERVRRILADIDEAENALVAGQAEPQGELRISAPVLFGRMHVAPGLIGFAARYPKVSVELILLDRMVDLVEEGIDAAIRLAQLEDSSMIAIGTGHVGRDVVASPDRLRESGVPQNPRALSDQPCVLFRGTAPSGSWRFREEGREFPVPVSGSFHSNDAASALDACAAGLGFGQFLSYQVEPYVKAGQLEVVLDEYAISKAPISIVYPGARRVSTRLRAFLDWMRTHLRERGS